MGKKYIITESQERIITRLVERELGPEESILVAKKNPFKYEEYKNARKLWNKNLKDGEFFYETTYPYFANFVKKSFEPIYNSFIGKTIRIKSSDNIVIVDPHNLLPISFTYETLVKNVTFEYEIQNDVFQIKYEKIPAEKFNFIGRYFSFTTKKWASFYVDSVKDPEIYNFMSIVGREMKKEYEKLFNNISEFPDEVFEIRKIQKKETDF